jgi:hypothetical protein
MTLALSIMLSVVMLEIVMLKFVILSVIMVIIIMQNVILMSVVMLSVIPMSVIMLSAFILRVIMLSVIMLSGAPGFSLICMQKYSLNFIPSKHKKIKFFNSGPRTNKKKTKPIQTILGTGSG